MAFIGRKPTNAPLTSDDIPNGIIGAADLATGLAKLTWDTTVKTSGFTASANTGYFCNTTSAAFTVTLPSTPTAGDSIQLVDYAGTFDTNALVISPNGNKIEGATSNLQLSGEREGATLVYIDSTQGWLATSGINEGTDALSPVPYSIDFLVVAGGGAGGGYVSGGGGAGGLRTSYGSTSGGGSSAESKYSVTAGTVITVTVGAGANAPTTDARGGTGSNSSISGSGLTTITSNGGGGGGTNPTGAGISGGSGGGGGDPNAAPNTGGSGTANQGYAGGDGCSAGGNDTTQSGGGGGGASAVGAVGVLSGSGGAGGAGLSVSITGSAVSYAGGGGGGSGNTTGGAGGTGGGGAGGRYATSAGTNGTANTGGGGGGSYYDQGTGGAGGSGVVILRMLTADYSGTTTGSPTVTTDGSYKVLQFNGSGSYTT